MPRIAHKRLRGGSTPAAFAVVVGINLNGLGVVRSLAHAGVPILILDHDLCTPEAATRFGRKARVRALSGPEFIADLLALRAELETTPVLILTQEESVATVSRARARLAGAYHFTLPEPRLVETLLDKHRFQAAAERHGCRIPRAVTILDDRALDKVAGLRFPCVLKPAAKSAAYGARFAKAYKVAAPEDVAPLWAAIRTVTDAVILQEWIEGTDADVYFCLQYRPSYGGPCASFVGRKTMQWPLAVGGTASCVPAPQAAAELLRLTDAFFSKVNFVGIGSMEYKRDQRDGQFYMVEPTVGRTDYQEEIACLNGVNIPFALYCGELGLIPPAQTPPGTPRAWRDPIGYAKALAAGAKDPSNEVMPMAQVCDAYFRLNDPIPYLALKLAPLRRRLKAMGFFAE
jgi:D-aspartate ligase